MILVACMFSMYESMYAWNLARVWVCMPLVQACMWAFTYLWLELQSTIGGCTKETDHNYFTWDAHACMLQMHGMSCSWPFKKLMHRHASFMCTSLHNFLIKYFFDLSCSWRDKTHRKRVAHDWPYTSNIWACFKHA